MKSVFLFFLSLLLIVLSCSGVNTNYNTDLHKEGIYPTPDEFVPCEKEPQLDLDDIKNKLKYNKKIAEIEGRVLVNVLVDINNKPVKFIIEHTDHELLNDVAINALKKGKFKAAIQNGKPINCWIIVPVNFRLN